MKQVTIVRVGFYHPSNANWSYGVWLVIDETGAKLYKKTFGGDSRMIEKMKKENIEVETLYVGVVAEYKNKDIKAMEDIENYKGFNY